MLITIKPFRYFSILVLGLISAASLLFLVNTLRSTLANDELQAYMPISLMMARGFNIYTTLIDHQPPGVFIMSVPFIWLLGNTTLAAKVAVVVYTCLFIIAVGYIANRLTHSWVSVVLALVLGSFFSAAYGNQVGINVSSYAAIMVTLGLACACVPQRKPTDSLWLFAGGALVGFAFMTKATILIEVPALVWIIYLLHHSRKSILLLMAGIITGILAICLAFAVTGTFNEMIYVAFTMNFGYAGLVNASAGTTQSFLTERLPFIINYLLPITLPYLSALIVMATIAFIWNIVQARQPMLFALGCWVLGAFVNSGAALALHPRYFFHVYAPLILLAVFQVESLLKPRWVWIGYVGAVGLLIIPIVNPIGVPPAQGDNNIVSRSDYNASLNFVSTHLAPSQCLLLWGGDAGGLLYYGDLKPCSRIIGEGSMMISEIYDIRQMRMWYFQDILASKPRLLAQISPWGFFSQMARLATYHVGLRAFYDNYLKISFYPMDWSTFHDTSITINNEILLRGYDLIMPPVIKPGATIKVIPYWQTIKPPTYNYQAFVQLLPADYRSALVSVDQSPTDPDVPTSQWTRPGEINVGRVFELTIPANLKSGNYVLVMGLYGLSQDNQFIQASYFQDGAKQALPFIPLQNLSIP